MARQLILAAVLSTLPFTVGATDFGTFGPVFPVEEPSILDTIQSRLGEMEQSGELETWRKEMETTTRGYVNRPNPVTGIKKATEPASFEIDLSIILERDLHDHEGRVFARAGTRINPLEHSRFNKRIIVFDGDDPAQVAFALSKGNELDTLLVLINGAPLELMRAHGRRFYFDQQGVIAARFAISRIPSVITRIDPFMRITEVPVGDAQ